LATFVKSVDLQTLFFLFLSMLQPAVVGCQRRV